MPPFMVRDQLGDSLPRSGMGRYSPRQANVAEQIQQALSILRRKQVEARTGLSRSTLYAYIGAGRFPAPVKLGDRAVGWIESEVDSFLAAQVERSRKSE